MNFDKSGSQDDPQKVFPGLSDSGYIQGKVESDLAFKPYWGKREPEEKFEFVDRDGNHMFYAGLYTYGVREEWVPLFFDGLEWVKRVPAQYTASVPLYNLLGLYGDGSASDLTKTVIVVRTPRHAEVLNKWLSINNNSYVAISWFGGMKATRNLDVEPLRGRDILLWADNNEFSYQLMNLVANKVAALSSSLGRVETPAYKHVDWSCIDAVNEGNAIQIYEMLMSAVQVPKESPKPLLNSEGFSNLEGDIPEMFIREALDRFGVLKNGVKTIPSHYISCMEIIKFDPAFQDFLKYDVATASIVWDTRTYPTIDDMKNAILRRLSKYGMMPSKQSRDDIVMSIASEPGRKINSIRDFVESLAEKYDRVEETVVDELLSHITFREEQAGIRFEYKHVRRIFEIFFTKAALRIYTSGSEAPYGNDCVPILVGNQGIGKGRFTRYLAMCAHSERFYIDLGNKAPAWGSPDWIRLIVGKFIAELGEMQTLKKDEINTIKSGISETQDTYTPKHKEGVKVFPRTVSFFGTGNDDQFLRDTTGNRRFYPAFVESIDHKGLYEKEDLAERVWAYFFGIAKSIVDIRDADRMEGKTIQQTRDFLFSMYVSESEEFTMYINKVRAGAMDVGMIGEVVRDAILRMEAKEYLECVNNDSRVTFDILEVAKEIYGDRITQASVDFKNKCKYVFSQLGYTYGASQYRGGVKRVFFIPKKSPLLTSRLHKPSVGKSINVSQEDGDANYESRDRRTED